MLAPIPLSLSLLSLLLLFISLPSTLLATEAAYPMTKEERQKWHLPEVTYPKDNPYQKSVEELGKQLFFDPRLTGDRALSCASCHFPGTGWSDPLPNREERRQTMERQTPSLINVAYQSSFFWDGRGRTLEGAIAMHLKELQLTHGEAPQLPRAYQQKFRDAFGSERNADNTAKAIANFLRTIVVSDSPFDRWIAGDTSAISQSAKNGFLLFTGKAECSKCHNAPNFSDSAFHNIGLNTLDPGRFDVSGNPADRMRFRTSALRQVSRTSPYMHMGNKKSLMRVIEFYSHGGDRHGKGNELSVLRLTEKEEQELLDFLISLTGSDIATTIPRLPMGH